MCDSPGMGRADELLVDRYELRSILGRGGMAEVRDGWDTRLSRPVAIKLLHSGWVTDHGLRRRFDDEARAAAALNHPNIVVVHDSGEHHGTPFIVMERLPGRTLADEIAAGPLSIDRLRAVLSDVLAALAAAHGAGILHRDIKPGNVLIAASGVAKLSDFGIAKTDGGNLTRTGELFGTVNYLSPQRLTGQPASASDDLYAVGVLGYEALTGQRPFDRDNPAATMRAILDEPAVPIRKLRPDVDPGMVFVLESAMAREPQFRFGDAEAMRAALVGPGPARPATRVMTTPLPAVPPSTLLPPPPPLHARRSRVKIALIAAAAAAAVILGVILLAVDRPPQHAPATPVAPPTTTAPTAVMSIAPSPPVPVDEGPGNGDKPGHKKKGRQHD
jgi:serine/threonine protein kinase